VQPSPSAASASAEDTTKLRRVGSGGVGENAGVAIAGLRDVFMALPAGGADSTVAAGDGPAMVSTMHEWTRFPGSIASANPAPSDMNGRV
jgi:hypothetical protein